MAGRLDRYPYDHDHDDFCTDAEMPSRTSEKGSVRGDADRSIGVRFDAELDVCELGDRDRPGLTWPAEAIELSRSRVALRSRRMCYVGRRVLLAVHLIDDLPVPLCGRVAHCSYDAEGMYRVELELARVPEQPEVGKWLAARRRR